MSLLSAFKTGINNIWKCIAVFVIQIFEFMGVDIFLLKRNHIPTEVKRKKYVRYANINGNFICLLFLVLLFFSCEKESVNNKVELTFDEKLYALSDLQITEITPQNGYPRQFEIYISQPLDHENPEGTRFNQQIFLSHRDESAPVVFLPSGYSARASTICELSEILNANQIYVSHRFMREAEPDVMEWDYLTVEQAAADFHCIVQMFKTIYEGKWVSYGASKNGSTALFHKRFYPDDVDATLAQVAPISFAAEDPRYEAFLENDVDQEICDKIKRFQVELLENRDGILPFIRNYMDNSSLTYSIPEGVILEFETLEYYFAFWQYGTEDISAVPDTGNTAEQLYQFILGEGYLPYYSDEGIAILEPFYYQMYTELGYYRLIDDHLSHLLVDLPDPSYSYFAPEGVSLVFNSLTMQDVNNWLQTGGDNIIYIYGEIDPWTAGAVELTGETNAIKIIQPGANHLISLYDLDERDLVYSTLEDWLDLTIEVSEPVLSKSPHHREETLRSVRYK